jgi:hypothetical protein
MTRQYLFPGRPAWLDQPLLAIPTLELRSYGDGTWGVRFQFPISPISITTFSYVQRNFPSRNELEIFLREWEESPETTVREWFDREPPRRLAAGEMPPPPSGPEVAANAEDLGL